MNTLTATALSLRLLAREWRSGDLAVLFLSLLVAVTALSGVGFLVDRIDRAMQMQATQVLAADLRLQSPDVIDGTLEAEGKRRGLATSRITSTLSVVVKGDATQLSNVHAAAAGYPLRGQVRVSDVPFGLPRITTQIPAPGQVWPDSRVMAALNARVGDVVNVGELQLRVTQVLVSRPDQGSGFVDLAPALLMHESDLAATQLIKPGSRVRYSRLFAGERAQMAAFNDYVAKNKKPAERLRDIAEMSPEVNNAQSRAAKFLQLASLASVLLCAVAIAMTARRYVKRHLDLVALLKTLGASQREVLWVSLTQLVVIALIATALGALIGLVAHSALLQAVQGMIEAELPAVSWQPVLLGLMTAMLLLVGFALPSMVQLSRVPAIRILRRDIGAPPLAAILAFGPAVASVALLILWITRDWKLAGWFVLGLAAATLVLSLAGWGLVWLAGRSRGSAGAAWRYGVANLARRRAESVVQLVALGLGLSALLLLAVIRGDLIDDWRNSLPKTAPNYFFVNITPDERGAFETYLSKEGGELTRVLPMIRGRMIEINGEPVRSRRFQSDRGDGFAQREQNLTWADKLGPDNKIISGKWFTAEDHGKPLVSVSTDFMESMNLKLGDKLKFDIAGEQLEASIASFREVQWDSMQPNFFLMFPPGLLEGAAGTYMASARFKPTNPATVANLVRQFPGVSIFDMDDLLGQVRSLIEKAVMAVQSVFAFTLLAGVMVLLAAVQSTRDERRFESAMLRALGARRSVVIAGVLVEFSLLGLLAGFLAAIVAAIGGYILATQLLEVPYRPNPLLWLTGMGLGTLLVCAAGLLATRSALSAPPVTVLRNG